LEDFNLIDLRVAKIERVAEHPNSEKMLVSFVFDGDEMRNIGSAVKNKVTLEEMSGLCIIWANLKPKKTINFLSQGMILFAIKDGKFELIRPPEDSKPGERCYLKGKNISKINNAEPMLKSRSKTKRAFRCMPYFHTDKNAVV